MKILFWILAVLSIPAGLFISFVCWLGQGFGLACTIIGEVVYVLGIPAVLVSVICAVLGIIRLRKGKVKAAVIFALVGLLYSGFILGGMFLGDAVDTMRMEKYIEDYDKQLYGENWNAAPAIEGLPELYQEVLNKVYVAVRDEWPADQLIDLSVTEMTDYYGEASLDNIGFILMDVNGDDVDELMIGTTAPVKEGGTALFCLYSDPENPHATLDNMEGEIYYLHPGEGDTHVAEIGGANASWLLKAEENSNLVDINYQEVTMDSAGRLTLEMIPFSQYK